MPPPTDTHEWRITALEQRMDRLERKLDVGIYMLLVNLVGVILVLARVMFFGGTG